MTKKAEVIVEDTGGKPIGDFTSKTLTKLFNQLETGTVINFSISENGLPPQFVGNYVVRGTQGETPVPEPPIECPKGQHWDEAQGKCVDDIITPPPIDHTCPEGEHWDAQMEMCVPDTVTPPPPEGTILYDSHRDSKLHDSKVRTVTVEGDTKPDGKGLECHASGSPKIQVNNDGTFSLICQAGHGRFYGYTLNYDAALEIEVAFWAGDGDCSLKMRSRHNEGGACENRFGGYGFSIDQHSSYDAKRETCHNVHDQSKSGSIPAIKAKEYHIIRFEVKDEGNSVAQIAKLDAKEVMKKVDTAPKPYMTAKATFANQSYFWVRSNVTKATGELRIKSLKIIKL